MSAAAMAAFIAIVATPADARSPAQCQAEIKEYCGDVPKGAGRVNACLYEHLEKLSPACSDGLKQMRQKPEDKRRFRRSRPSWLDPCVGDIKRLCKNVPSGRGSIAECLTQHQADLSIACGQAFVPTPEP